MSNNGIWNKFDYHKLCMNSVSPFATKEFPYRQEKWTYKFDSHNPQNRSLIILAIECQKQI